MPLPNQWERYVYTGSCGGIRLAVEQGAAFRELVMYTRDDRTVISNEHGDFNAEQFIQAINEGREALKKRRK